MKPQQILTIVTLLIASTVRAAVAINYDTDIYHRYHEHVDVVGTAVVNLYAPAYLPSVAVGGAVPPHDGPTLNIYGGEIGAYIRLDEGVVNFYGGQLSGDMASTNGRFYHVFGSGFDYNPDLGRLTGFWQDGTAFSMQMNPLFVGGGRDQYNVTWSHIVLHEVPEPATILLLALGATFAGRRRQSCTGLEVK